MFLYISSKQKMKFKNNFKQCQKIKCLAVNLTKYVRNRYTENDKILLRQEKTK